MLFPVDLGVAWLRAFVFFHNACRLQADDPEVSTYFSNPADSRTHYGMLAFSNPADSRTHYGMLAFSIPAGERTQLMG
jgi:hypothetical protein